MENEEKPKKIMQAWNHTELKRHVGHKIVCVQYPAQVPPGVAIECEDCNEVLFRLRRRD